MPLFQLRYSPPSGLEPETVLASDVFDAVIQARNRLERQGGAGGVLFLDGVVVQSFDPVGSFRRGVPTDIDMDQIFASAGIYVFRSIDPFQGICNPQAKVDPVTRPQSFLAVKATNASAEAGTLE